MKNNSKTSISSISEYVDFIEEACSKKGRYLFRGQREGDQLLPKLLRDDVLITKSPLIEKIMFDDFKKRGRPFLKIEPQNEYEWLALAQHHGMFTRLLDWTTSALAALWFTVTSKRGISNDGVIWILRFDIRDIKYPSQGETPDKFKEIRFSLNRLGVNKVSLFPDFGGLCDHLNWIQSEEIGRSL